jgi:ribosomal protein S3
MVIYLAFKELLISKGIHAFVRFCSSASYSEMDLENQMSNKSQGLLVASSGQVKHKRYAKKKKYVSGLLYMRNVH